MSRTNKKAAPDPRELHLAKNPGRVIELKPSEAMLSDLRYFREQIDKNGKAISWVGLRDWMETRHGVVIGRVKLRRIALQAGITPWWKP